MHRIILIALFLAATAAHAEEALSPEARIAALEAQVAALQKRLDEITAPARPAPAEAPSREKPGLSLGAVTVGGMIETQFSTAVGGSLRQPIFTGTKGNSDFVLTHAHPSIRATLNDKTSAYADWCMTHMGMTATYEAYLEHAASETVDVKAGRWLLPFGAWNSISNPAQFPTVSRPLMYLGHEERGIVLQGGPRPILNDEHSDIGLLVSGQKEMGAPILGYAAYVSNGFGDQFSNYPDAWIDYRANEDNNSHKSLGGRLSLTMGGLTLGASATGGKWDTENRYAYSIRGLDATWRNAGGLTLRAEYATNPVNRPADSGGRLRRHGWYAMADQRLSPKWNAVAMYSTLSESPTANVRTVSRLTLGADYRLADTATLKAEVGRLFIGRFIGDPTNAPQGTDYQDVTTLKMSTVVSF
ncbi:MAG TPA: porin [Armatimonadota bacterium]|jgi:hypothetical protein